MKRRAETRVAVIGAGIAGLAAAHELSSRGVNVTVFEETKLPGGRINTQTIGRLAFDSGADFFSENYVTLKHYAKELGIEWLPTRAGGRHRVIRGGKPYYLQFATTRDLFRFKLLSPWSRLRLGVWLARLLVSRRRFDLFDLSTIPGQYDFGNAADYVSRVAGKEVADYMIDSFTSIMQFHRAKEISTAALFALMQTMIAKGTRFALRSTPAGTNQIPFALAKRLGVRYRATVSSVTPVRSGHVNLTVAGEKPITFDAIVLATPAPAARAILGSSFPETNKFLATVRYAATITVAFRVPVDLFPDHTHLSYVPFVESQLIGGYANEGAKLGARVGRGESSINVYLHEEAAVKMMDWSDQKIFAGVLAELKKLCPEAAHSNNISPLAIARWPLAMPKFDHGYVSKAREFLASHQGKNRIYFAGDYLNAPWTEGAARSGQRAAAALINQLS